MKILLTSSSPQEFALSVSYVQKQSIPLLANISIQQNTEQKQSEELNKRLLTLNDIFPAKEWLLNTEFHFHDPESPKLEIVLEGELLQTLHDIIYYGSQNERLHVGVLAKANYAFGSSKREISFTADEMVLDISGNVEKHFRYISKKLILPGGKDVWKSSLELKRCTILVELEVNDIVVLTEMLPLVSDTNAKMLEEKLFCDIELVSSDGMSIPCHKAMLCTCSDMFKAKCEGKLDEPFKDKMTMDMTGESAHALLEFIYCGRVRKPLINSKIAFEFFQAGHKYGINGLEEVMIAIFLQKSHEWYHIDVAFGLVRFMGNYEGEHCVKLMEKAIEATAMKSEELNDCVVAKEAFTQSPLLAVQMFALMAMFLKVHIQ